MASEPASETTEPTEPPDAPIRRIRRGCLPIIFLLLMVAVFNYLQYGLNIVVLVAGLLMLLAIVAFVIVVRSPSA